MEKTHIAESKHKIYKDNPFWKGTKQNEKPLIESSVMFSVFFWCEWQLKETCIQLKLFLLW